MDSDSSIFKPFLFHFKNEKLYLKEIININLFKLLCEVNKKLVENIHIETINENKIRAFICVKHIFKDIGIPQYLLKFIVEFDEINNVFLIETENNTIFDPPFEYNNHSQSQVLTNISLSIHYTKITEHEYQYSIHIKNNITEDRYDEFDEIVEKVVIKIINMVFTNLNTYINHYVC